MKYSLVLFCREQFLEMYDSVMTAKIENYHLPITKMLRKFSLLCHTDKGCRAIPIVHFLTSFRVWGELNPCSKESFILANLTKSVKKVATKCSK